MSLEEDKNTVLGSDDESVVDETAVEDTVAPDDEESKPASGLAGALDDSSDQEDGKKKKRKSFKKGKKEKDPSAPKKGKFAIPFLGKKKEEEEEYDPGVSLGSNSTESGSPFADTIKIEDEDIGHIPSAREAKKAGKRNNLALGAKYGGQRRIFGFLAIAMVIMMIYVAPSVIANRDGVEVGVQHRACEIAQGFFRFGKVDLFFTVVLEGVDLGDDPVHLQGEFQNVMFHRPLHGISEDSQRESA